MEVLEQIWELIGNFFYRAQRTTGARHYLAVWIVQRSICQKQQPKIDAINALEPKYQTMGDAELKQQTALFRERLNQGRHSTTC